METQQLSTTRLELPFSLANGYTPKEQCSYELQAFFLCVCVSQQPSSLRNLKVDFEQKFFHQS